jgi:hypothetical protein
MFRNGSISQQQYDAGLLRIRQRMDDLAAARQPDLRHFLGQLPGIGTLVTSFTTAAGAIGLVTAAFHMMERAGEAGIRFLIERGKAIDDVADTAERLGLTVGGLSELQSAAKFADIEDFAAVSGGLEKMLAKVGQATDPASEAAAAFRKLHLDANELIGLKPDQMFARIAKEIAEIPTNAERAAVIREIFGKSGNELKLLIERFDEFRQRAEDSGAIITEDQAAVAAEVDEAMKSINAMMESIGNNAILTIVPAMKSFAQSVADISKNTQGIQQFIAALFPAITERVVEFEKLRQQNIKNARSEAAIRRMKASSPEQAAENMAKIEEAEALKAENERVKLFDKLMEQYREQQTMLVGGREAVEDMKIEQAGLTDIQRSLISMQRDAIEQLKEEKAIREAITHAAEQDAKLKQERIDEAERIKQSLMSAEDVAAGRLARAMDLVVTGELTDADVDRLADKEARSLTKSAGEFRLQAIGRGSQEDIAATLGRRQESDSQRFEVMKQKLIELARKPPLEVNNVGAF